MGGLLNIENALMYKNEIIETLNIIEAGIYYVIGDKITDGTMIKNIYQYGTLIVFKSGLHLAQIYISDNSSICVRGGYNGKYKTWERVTTTTTD